MTDTPLHSPVSFHGRVETAAITSRVLADNPLGDPATREVPVWLPPELGPDEGLGIVANAGGPSFKGLRKIACRAAFGGPLGALQGRAGARRRQVG